MKGRASERAARDLLLPDLPGFAVRRSLLFANLIGLLPTGIAFDASGFEADGAYAEAFVQPLYEPSDGIDLSYGRRLGGARFWRIDPADPGPGAAAIHSGGLPFLRSVPGPLAFAALVEAGRAVAARTAAQIAREEGRPVPGPPHPMAPGFAFPIAASSILADRRYLARSIFEEMRSNPRDPIDAPSYRDAVDRCAVLERLLDGPPTAAPDQLTAWRAHTLPQLRLEPWAAPDPARSIDGLTIPS